MTFHLRAGRLKEVSRTREPVFALDPLFVTLLCAGVLANFYPIPYFAGLSFYLGSTATYMMFLLFGWQRACVCACAVSLAQAAGDKEIRSVFACPERGPAGTESGVSCLLIARQRNE